MSKIEIDDFDSAFRVLGKLLHYEPRNNVEYNLFNSRERAYAQDLETSDLIINPELQQIHIRIVGPRYDSSITGSIAEGLVEFQRQVQRGVQNLEHSVHFENDKQRMRIRKDIQKQLDLNFVVRNGSTEMFSGLQPVLDMVERVIMPWPVNDQFNIILCTLLMLGGGWITTSLGGKYISTRSSRKIEEARVQSQLQESRSRDELIKHLVDKQAEVVDSTNETNLEILSKVIDKYPEIKYLEKSVSEGISEIAKKVDDGGSLFYGQYELDAHAINNLKNNRVIAPREMKTLEGAFVLFYVNQRDSLVAKIKVNFEGQEYSLSLNEDQFSAEDIKYLSHRAADRDRVQMKIQITTNNGNISDTKLIYFVRDKKQVFNKSNFGFFN